MESEEKSKPKEPTQTITLINGYLDSEKAAAYLDTSEKTLYRLRKDGKLRGYKLGKEWRYRLEDLDRMMKKSS